MDREQALQALGLTPREYLLKRAVPMVGAGIVVAAALWFVATPWLPGFLGLLLPPLVVAFAVAVAVLYPASAADRRRAQIDDALPFFMTHFGVLSTSNLPRTEIFRILGQKKEYQALGDELRRIHSLVVDWKMSLPEACRFIGKRSPSNIFADFLERLAHAMETGQDLEQFLADEQSVVMKEYATLYETSIYQIENWKDLYVSVVMSGAFFVIFAVITPVLTGNSPERLLMGVLAFMLFMEVILVMVLRLRLPADRLLHRLDVETRERRLRRRALQIAGALTLLLFPLLYLVTPLPPGLVLGASVTPMAVVGVIARRQEEAIKRREDNYAAFIRSVGASAAARGGSLRDVLKQVRHHNFGPLGRMVSSLYARLSWRIDDRRAWKHFSAESGSDLVDAFTDMFIEGVNTGGKPDRIGQIISGNVVRVLNLRKARYSTAGTFRGIVVGLTASMAFIMFLGVGLLGLLGDLFSGTPGTSNELNPLELNFDADVALVEELIFWLLLIHSLAAGLLMKMVDGGSLTAGLALFVALLWVSVALAFASDQVLPRVFDFGGAG
ncbi:MAG: type II secretion system F family protein [Thermoplasmatota archaeon]